MGKADDYEFWQRYKKAQHEAIHSTPTLDHIIATSGAPCPTCGQPHSKLKTSRHWYGELVCGYCFDDMSHGQLPQRRKW